MSISPQNNSTGYAYLPRINICERTGIHNNLRRVCDNLWSTRAPGCDFRLVRTNNFGAWGRGNMGYILKKFDNTYVIGARGHAIDKNKYPQHAHKARGDYLYVNQIPKEEIKPTDFFWGLRDPFFIIKDEYTLMPAYVDKARENMLWGMGLYHFCPQQDRTLLKPNELRDFGGAFFGIGWQDAKVRYVQGGLIFTDETVDAYGATIRDPIVQVYDKGLYNKGREALLTLRDLLKIYIERHGIIEESNWWAKEWHHDFVWKVYTMYHDRGIEGLTPHWILDEHQKSFLANHNYNPHWMQKRALQIAQLTTEQIRKLWRAEALQLGICRFVERDTPVYNEVPPLKPVKIDYDRVIRDH